MKQLPPGRRETRTRLYTCTKFELVYDSTTSDMHPDDYLRTSEHTQLHAVIDYADSWRGRRSEMWFQVSSRRIKREDPYELLRYIAVWPNPFSEAS